MFWELAKQPTWQDRVFEELNSNINLSNEEFACFADLLRLPVLDAVIQEALRLHPAAPASLPRETPAGGRVLNGIHVPERVGNSVQPRYEIRHTNHVIDNGLDAVLHYSARPGRLRRL